MDLYRAAHEFPAMLRGRNTVVTAADLAAIDNGLMAIRWRAAQGRVVRAHRGAYVLGPSLPDLLDRVRAALAVSPTGSVVGFHTAAALLGFGVIDSAAIHLVVGSGGPFPQRPGIVAHQSVVEVGAPAMVRGIACTPAPRCAIDLARSVGRADALSTLDACLSGGAATLNDLQAELDRQCGLRGIRQARELVRLADRRPECRQESHLRLILHDGGVRDLLPQLDVHDEHGQVRYRLDLGDPATRVAAEYDGESHLDRQRLRLDRERHNWLETRGWRMRYFTDQDIYTRPELVVATVRAALRTP